MSIEEGQRAHIAVSAATLWASPKSAEELDRVALGQPAAVRDWVASMTREQRVDGLVDRSLTQVLLGDEVFVEDIEDGWARVIVADQPSSLDERGYPGWLPVDQLAPIPDTDGTLPHIVASTATSIRDEPDGEVLIPGVGLGTRLAIIDEEPYRGWARVVLPGPRPAGWVRLHDVTSAPDKPEPEETGRASALNVASQLLDVPYVWGGLSAYGVDCSSLVYLVYRQLGIQVPRDAHDQAEASTKIDPDDAKVGDLYFFARPGKTIHHVGVAAGPNDDGERMLIHAAGNYGKVVHEAFTPERAETLVSAGRVFAAE